MTRTETSPEQRRRNVRLAWVLAAFALFMLLSSVPFWKGLFNMVMSSAQ
jgi:F0F1-type ATP synthase membrane subunit b/b'